MARDRPGTSRPRAPAPGARTLAAPGAGIILTVVFDRLMARSGAVLALPSHPLPSHPLPRRSPMPHDHAGTPGPIAPDWRTNGARIVKAGALDPNHPAERP